MGRREYYLKHKPIQHKVRKFSIGNTIEKRIIDQVTSAKLFMFCWNSEEIITPSSSPIWAIIPSHHQIFRTMPSRAEATQTGPEEIFQKKLAWRLKVRIFMTALNDAKFARDVNSKTSRPSSLRISFHKKQETINSKTWSSYHQPTALQLQYYMIFQLVPSTGETTSF